MTWEYRTVMVAAEWASLMGGKMDSSRLDQTMNEAGRDGWELVAAFDTNMAQGRTHSAVLIFKRPRDR